MTATINASTSSGVIVTSDTSGALALQTANTTAMTIDTSQNVGLGVTPSTFTGIGATVFESNGGATAYRGVTSGVEQYTNTYFSGGFLYKASGYATRFTTATGAFTWYTAPSGTAGNAITFTQSLAVGKGTTLVLEGGTSSSGTGIAFPATQSASSDANTLDDYEEGTFTPTDGSGASLSITFTNPKYTKIGRLVYVSIDVINYPTTSSTASAIIAGLPFANSAANVASGALVTTYVSANRSLVVGNSSVIYFYANASTSASSNVQLSGAVIYGWSAVYQTS